MKNILLILIMLFGVQGASQITDTIYKNGKELIITKTISRNYPSVLSNVEAEQYFKGEVIEKETILKTSYSKFPLLWKDKIMVDKFEYNKIHKPEIKYQDGISYRILLLMFLFIAYVIIIFRNLKSNIKEVGYFISGMLLIIISISFILSFNYLNIDTLTLILIVSMICAVIRNRDLYITLIIGLIVGLMAGLKANDGIIILVEEVQMQKNFSLENVYYLTAGIAFIWLIPIVAIQIKSKRKEAKNI